MRGKRITTLDALCKCALNRKAVVGFHTFADIKIPAAFLVNMQAWRINVALKRGLWIYQKDNTHKT